jgi:uncharacterized protein
MFATARGLKRCAWILALVGLLLMAVSAMAQQSAVGGRNGELRTGVFAGPVIGLKYETPSVSGMTSEKGEFRYRPGESVTFAVGGLVLGTTKAAEHVNLAQLVPEYHGSVDKVIDPAITNMARLLQTLDYDQNLENGLTITPQTHALVGRWPLKFDQSEEDFADDRRVTHLLGDLYDTKGVFKAGLRPPLRNPAAARNELRRNIRGIIKITDVKIPMRDGTYVLADVFRPEDSGQHPAVVNIGIYGKAFQRDCICNPDDAQKREEWEDRYFTGNPDGFHYENHETVNAWEWVPKGYVVIRVDGRGACNTPGTREILSRQEAEDFYDSIEWAAKQTWSNGNIGLWGQSYYAMNMPSVASLQPPHLKAMIPIEVDFRPIEDSMYNGGLFNEEFWRSGFWDHSRHAVCGEPKAVDFIAISKAHPFMDPAIYGEKGQIIMTPDMSKVVTPQWITMPTTHVGNIHTLGSSEAYIRSASKDKMLSVVSRSASSTGAYGFVTEHMAFFDYWLKGVKNGIMDEPRVRLEVQTGWGGFYEQKENEWPIARTKYTKIYLDASPSKWEGDGRRKDFMKLSGTAPVAEKKTTYSAQVNTGPIFPEVDTGTIVSTTRGGTPCWSTGVSFVTDPLPENLVLAGYMKLGLWVSSTSSDMDIYASLRVLDENNREINYEGSRDLYAAPSDLRNPTNIHPMGKGWLKVSHRKLDPARSTDYDPKYTHLESDYAPLKNNEVVPVEVEVWPTAVLVKKGHRLRLDIQPHDGCGLQRHTYDASYHTGAQNTIYTGPNHPSYLQLPVIPPAGKITSVAAK